MSALLTIVRSGAFVRTLGGFAETSSSAAGACWQPWEDAAIVRAYVGRRLPWHSVEKIKAQLPHRSIVAIRTRSSRLKRSM